MKAVAIGEKWVGSGHPVFIIAEAGSNHNRSLDQARKLIDVAAYAGADAVKFQTYSADTLYSRRTPVFPGESEEPYEVVKRVELPREWQPELAGYAREKGLVFLSTPFDYHAVDELAGLDMPAFKWASSEINDLPMLEYVATKGKPVIISTGMANLADIQEAVDAVRRTGNHDLILLHCVAVYPTPFEEVNLRSMETIRNAFGLPTGYSDHTLGVSAVIAAVALGACIIEKHFTLDRGLSGPDHFYALEPQELKDMVLAVRDTEKMLGQREKRPSKGEEAKLPLSRRSIIAAADIPRGTVITRDMLVTKRPGFGVSPKFMEVVVGRRAATDIAGDTPLTWDMV